MLIAGGRNKGLDLAELAEEADHIRAVVAIGEAGRRGRRRLRRSCAPFATASSMDDAVEAAAVARPAAATWCCSRPRCASFDWYGSYSERGDDFVRAVSARLAEAPPR